MHHLKRTAVISCEGKSYRTMAGRQMPQHVVLEGPEEINVCILREYGLVFYGTSRNI